MNFNEDIQISIIRLFTGEASPEEKKSIRAWLNQSDENKQLYNELKDLWLASGIKTNADKYNLEQAIQEFREKAGYKKQQNDGRLVIFNVLKYAAIFLLIVGIPLSYFAGKHNNIVDSFSTVTCVLGDKSMIYLPDSSKVWLNSGSTLQFSNNFKKGERQVFLEGEAYFSVVKDKKNPFTVKSGDIQVEVLGTEFNLKAYPDENHVSATLVEGSLKVSGLENPTIIKPGQKLKYDNQTKEMALFELSDTSPETEWKDGRLVFRNESLEELEKKLERWFDVDIVLADDQVKKRRYTGTIERESILEVMSYFSLAQSVEYKIDGNKVTFFNQSNK
ncbi:FecR family protein [Maribellus maritimus]|uniref:FecR family protein n=1 Tax=Maribellus maritimus TaxID=2870838 RepID=UPI001EEA1B52|nr:FecR domain-containing protein [Maribellus maritimus]MCG6190088.1 DUF4974 domain-containing protein [Maribellus maritimus]